MQQWCGFEAVILQSTVTHDVNDKAHRRGTMLLRSNLYAPSMIAPQQGDADGRVSLGSDEFRFEWANQAPFLKNPSKRSTPATPDRGK
jgi:hypothetical protein